MGAKSSATRITAYVLTLNEEERIERCLAGLVTWADEVLIIDSGSTDATVNICKRLGARVVFRAWPNSFADQCNFADACISTGWIFRIDADEIVSPELGREILETVQAAGPHVNGFYVHRIEYVCGGCVRYSVHKSCLLRLYRRGSGTWHGVVHAYLNVPGEVGHLTASLVHFSSPTVESFLGRINLYTSMEVKAEFEMGKRFSFLKLIFDPLETFFRRYIGGRGFLFGFRDGKRALIIACIYAIERAVKQLKLLEASLYKDKKF